MAEIAQQAYSGRPSLGSLSPEQKELPPSPSFKKACLDFKARLRGLNLPSSYGLNAPYQAKESGFNQGCAIAQPFIEQLGRGFAYPHQAVLTYAAFQEFQEALKKAHQSERSPSQGTQTTGPSNQPSFFPLDDSCHAPESLPITATSTLSGTVATSPASGEEDPEPMPWLSPSVPAGNDNQHGGGLPLTSDSGIRSSVNNAGHRPTNPLSGLGLLGGIARARSGKARQR